MPNGETEHHGRVALGAELAAYRRAARYTQAQLAQLTGYSRSTIANVETGRQHVHRRFWEHADAALRTGGTLATAHDDLDAGTRRELRAAARQVSSARQAQHWQDSLHLGTTSPDTGRAADGAAHARLNKSQRCPAMG